jgi:hypothetical protein
MKPFGNSEPSVPQTYAPGPWHRKPVTGSRTFRSNRASMLRRTSRAATIRGRTPSARSIRYSPRATILVFSPRPAPAPSTFIDVHPRAEATLPHRVTASVDWIFQWRESLQDGVYSVPGFLIIPAGKRFVGNRPGTKVRWQANQHLWFQADYGIFMRQICQRKSARPQTELLGPMGRLQILGVNQPNSHLFSNEIQMLPSQP